ncbi:hypothetical protein LEMLEM_LOCUS19661 [Lemmus lemmus]
MIRVCGCCDGQLYWAVSYGKQSGLSGEGGAVAAWAQQVPRVDSRTGGACAANQVQRAGAGPRPGRRADLSRSQIQIKSKLEPGELRLHKNKGTLKGIPGQAAKLGFSAAVRTCTVVLSDTDFSCFF